MGLITGSDDDLHHDDMSHRRTAPHGMDQAWWDRLIAAHIERHKAGAPELPRKSPRNATRPPTTGTVPPPTT